jgi:hypothetical protein
MANVGLLASGPLVGGEQLVVSLHLRFAAGVCVLTAGLLMGGGAVAVADPDSSGSSANSTDTNQQHSTGAKSPKKTEPGGTATTDEKKGSGVVAAVPDQVAPVSKVVAPVPKVVAPVSKVVAPVPKVVAPVPEVVAPVPKVVAPVPDAVAPVPDAVAPVPDAVAPVPEVVAAVPNEVPPVTNVVAPVPDAVAPAPDAVAPAPDAAAPAPDAAAPVPNLVAAVPNEVPPVTNVVPPVPNVDVVAPVPNGHAHANFIEGAGVLLLSGVLAYLTLRYVENPLRYRAASARPLVAIPLRTRRRTMVLGSTVALLGVALTATSFTWREHVTLQRANGNGLEHVTPQRANGNGLAALSTQDYPGARALLNNAKVAKLPMRPTVLEAKQDLPETTIDGCISDFTNIDVINCTYGDKAAARTIALAGGSHAEHWITALDLLGQLHGFKVVTYLKMGCPLTTEQVPKVTGDNQPYPKCHDWNQRVMAKLIGDHPDYVFTTSTRPWNIKPGDVVPANYIGIWQTLSDNNIPILAMRDTPWLVRDGRPYFLADCLADGGDAISCGVKRSDVLSDRNPTLDFVAQFPLLKPLDMSDAVCRKDICRAVEGNVLLYHDSHHLSTTYMRTMTSELGRQIGAATGWW